MTRRMPPPRTRTSRRYPAGDTLRLLQLIADSARPVVLDEIARLAPSPARDARDIVEELQRAGLVEVTERTDVGTIVSITERGRAMRRRA